MALWMTREHGGKYSDLFYQTPPEGQRLVRLCFAKREETLREAAEKLCGSECACESEHRTRSTLAWHDRKANLEHFESLLEQAQGADLIARDVHHRVLDGIRDPR